MNIKDADKLMNDIIKRTGSKLFVRKTVKQLISGYDDPLLTIANTVFPNLVTSKQFSLLFKAVKLEFIKFIKNTYLSAFKYRKMQQVGKILQ